MRILVNSSNLYFGGGVQKAVEFFNSCRIYGCDHEWFFMLSPVVGDNLDLLDTPPWINHEICHPSPARLLSGRSTRKWLKGKEREFRPDVVFSVFGPTYVKFGRPHVMGFAIPWITNPTGLAWELIPGIMKRTAFYFRIAYYKYWAKFADGYITETNSAADGLGKSLNIARERIAVVPNSCSSFYSPNQDESVTDCRPGPEACFSPVRLLVFTSYKDHKNLFFVPRVASSLRKMAPERQFRFVFTLPSGSTPWRRLLARSLELGVDGDLITVGYVPVADGPALYRSCDALFMPSVLEVFSANYPEAMAMGRPILTSDLDFSHDICGEAAEYFDPCDPVSAAQAILSVCDNREKYCRLQQLGKERLRIFGSSEDRFRSTLEFLIAAVE